LNAFFAIVISRGVQRGPPAYFRDIRICPGFDECLDARIRNLMKYFTHGKIT